MNCDDFELGWLAGIMEGEGSFYTIANRGRRYFRLSIESTDEDVITRVASLIGARCDGPLTRKDRPENKPRWRCSLLGKGAINVALALRPHMSRRRQTQINAAIKDAKR